MFHYVEYISTTHGDALVGYRVSLRVAGTNTVVPIFGDNNGTPIIATSTLANVALTDAAGNVSLFVDFGSYDVVIANPDGAVVKVVNSVPMNGGAKGDKGDAGPPGINPASVPSFAAISTASIAATTDTIQTSGYTVRGIGAATYVSVDPPAVGGRVVAQATAWRKQSADGRWWELLPNPYVTFDQLGTIGKPGFEANDIQGWKNVSAYLAEKDGAALKGRRTTYAVGEQTYRPGSTEWGYEPSPVIEGVGLTGFVHVDFMGATLRCRPGLRYGAFNADGPAPFTPAVYPNGSKRSTPYSAMVNFRDCSGPIIVENGTLDGNMDGLSLGGGYGDTGWQIPCTGISLLGHTGTWRWSNLRCINHGQDGGQLQTIAFTLAAPSTPGLIENCVFDMNARQGFSIVGGRGGRVAGSRFTRTGKGRFISAPGSGCDFESEGGNIDRDWHFDVCEFSGNAGIGWVADSGNGGDATFTRCRFVGGGGSSWALWPRMPGLKFHDCRIIGSVANPFSDGGVASNRSTEFHSCEFTNDPAYGGAANSQFLVDAGANNTAALYSDCEFRAVGGTQRVAVSFPSTRYRNCTFNQEAQADMNIAGVFTGDNVVNIPYPGYISDQSKVYDRLLLRGVKQPVTP